MIDDLYVRRFFQRPRRAHDVSGREAEAIARIAIENPTAAIHPLRRAGGHGAGDAPRLADGARNELEARKRALALMTHDDQLTRLLRHAARPRRAGRGRQPAASATES